MIKQLVRDVHTIAIMLDWKPEPKILNVEFANNDAGSTARTLAGDAIGMMI